MSEPAPGTVGELFDGVLARGPVRSAVDGVAWLRALLDAEAGLAAAGAAVGLVPVDAATRIGEVCWTGSFDLAALSSDAAAVGNPVVPLVQALEAAVGPGAWQHVHRGATSQDVMDTAMALVAQRALDVLAADVVRCAEAAADLAREHRDNRRRRPHAAPARAPDHVRAQGRRLVRGSGRGRHAAAGGARRAARAARWRRRHAVRRRPGRPRTGRGVRRRAGPAGAGPGLAHPAPAGRRPGRGARDRRGVLGKIALDVVLLAQTEVGEVAEGTPGRGGSSTMPHKRNPVAAVSARAAARRAPALVAELLASMEQEHERAAGAWHAEWAPLSDLLRTVGSAAAWLADCLSALEVDTARMRANLQGSGAALGAEAVAGR